MGFEQKIIDVILFMPGFLFSLSFHEAAHAYVAHRLGDDTAKNMGRVSLSPIPHIDILGTLILPILGLFSGFLFGWGKPVPVNYRNLKNFKRDGMWIAAAGPASNLILAVLFTGLLHVYIATAEHVLGSFLTLPTLKLLGNALVNYIFLNLALCFFNLIPIQPLDGSKILYGILPKGIADKVDHFSTRFGLIVLLILIVSGAFRIILWPPIMYVGKFLLNLV